MKKKKTVVIVDDNREFCAGVRDFLSTKENYEVIGIAYDGKAGYEMVLENKPDVHQRRNGGLLVRLGRKIPHNLH